MATEGEYDGILEAWTVPSATRGVWLYLVDESRDTASELFAMNEF